MSSFSRFWICFLLIFIPLACRAQASGEKQSVRLALVNVPDELLIPLLPDFEKRTGMRAEIVYTGNDPFSVGREGKADMIIAHYGHEGTESFVMNGFGLWPKTVFANQMALLGPPEDPAHIRELADAAEAFRRIATSGSRFLVNNGGGAKYLEEILWASAGVAGKGDWYLDKKSSGKKSALDASAAGAYVLWGLSPYLRLNRQEPLNLVPLVTGDPVFQRIMASIIVNPKKAPGVNETGAEAFQEYLLSPAVQARIRAFRYPDFDRQAWWPAGRNNSSKE